MHRTARNWTWIGAAAAIAALAAVVAIEARVVADDKPAVAPGRSDLAKDLVGTWVLTGTPEGDSNPPGKGARLKFFTGTHWMITQPDPKTGEVIFHHGGRYTLDGDSMAGTIDFANPNTASYIGQTHKFTIKVEGDTYSQVGQGNPFTETWKRVK